MTSSEIDQSLGHYRFRSEVAAFLRRRGCPARTLRTYGKCLLSGCPGEDSFDKCVRGLENNNGIRFKTFKKCCWVLNLVLGTSYTYGELCAPRMTIEGGESFSGPEDIAAEVRDLGARPVAFNESELSKITVLEKGADRTDPIGIRRSLGAGDQTQEPISRPSTRDTSAESLSPSPTPATELAGQRTQLPPGDDAPTRQTVADSGIGNERARADLTRFYWLAIVVAVVVALPVVIGLSHPWHSGAQSATQLPNEDIRGVLERQVLVRFHRDEDFANSLNHPTARMEALKLAKERREQALLEIASRIETWHSSLADAKATVEEKHLATLLADGNEAGARSFVGVLANSCLENARLHGLSEDALVSAELSPVLMWIESAAASDDTFAEGVCRQVVQRHPREVRAWRYLARFELAESERLRVMGRCDDAKDKCESAIKQVEAAMLIAPKDAGVRKDLSRCLTEQGDLFLRLRRPSEAKEAFEKSLALDEQLLDETPQSERCKRSIWVSHLKLAEAFEAIGKSEDALREVDAAIKTITSLSASRPDESLWQGEFAESYHYQARTLFHAGALSSAQSAIAQSVAIQRKRLDASPNDLALKRDLALMLEDQGQFAIAAEDGKTAAEALGESLALLRDVRAAGHAHAMPANIDFVRCVTTAVPTFLGMKMNAVAETSLREANDAIAALTTAGVNAPELDTLRMHLQTRQAMACNAKNDLDGEIEAFRRACKMGEVVLTSNPSDNEVRFLVANESSNMVGPLLKRFQIGQSLDDWNEAHTLAMRGMVLAKERSDASPMDWQARLSYAFALTRLAEVLKTGRGGIDAAMSSYENGLAAARSTRAYEAARPRSTVLMCQATTSLCGGLLQDERFEEALTAFTQLREECPELWRPDFADEMLVWGLGDMLIEAGDRLFAARRPVSARVAIVLAREIFDGLTTRSPLDVDRMRNKCIVLEKLTNCLVAIRDIAALRACSEDLLKAVVELECKVDDIRVKRSKAEVLWRLGWVYLELDEVDLASESIESGVELARDLSKSKDSNDADHRQYASALEVAAMTCLRKRDATRAKRHADIALSIVEPKANANIGDFDARRAVGVLRGLSAQSAELAGDSQAARTAFDQCVREFRDLMNDEGDSAVTANAYAYGLQERARWFLAHDRVTDAVSDACEAYAIRRRLAAGEQESQARMFAVANAQVELGNAYACGRQFHAAIECFAAVCDLLRTLHASGTLPESLRPKMEELEMQVLACEEELAGSPR